MPEVRNQGYHKSRSSPLSKVESVVDHRRLSLRLSSMRPLSLDATSVFQNLHPLLESTGIPSKTTCISTTSHENHSQHSQVHHLIQLSKSMRMHTQTQESVIFVDTFSSRVCRFNVSESLPSSAVWTTLQRPHSATRLSNGENTNLPDQMYCGMLMVTTNLGHGVL